MLRFKILASVVPLIAVAVFARGGLLPGPHPCIEIAETSVQIASMPWQAQLRVSFTDDPALATVRVQMADSADAADFAVVDDVDTAEAGACAANPATRLVAISAGDLSLLGRPRRLPDLCQVEDIFRARGGRPDRRRRQTSPPRSRLALNFSGLTLH
jgi:hypothetical protein